MIAESLTPRRFDHVTDVVLIGGGDLLLFVAQLAMHMGWTVRVVVAPRHAATVLPLAGQTLTKALDDLGMPVFETADINRWAGIAEAVPRPGSSLALCFGPAWIFSQEVCAWFNAGMINYNGIPIPRYLGGAHYTWQILNGDRTGGCVLQEITERLDRGPILRSHAFLHPPGVRIPRDYYRSNYDEGRLFMKTALADMRTGVPFPPQPFHALEADRLYFPRLITVEHGYIDWSWTAEEIERFCCAFDDPYPGAATFVEGTLVRLAGVRRPDEREAGEPQHPYCSGLVIRRVGDQAWVAAGNGTLVLGTVRREDGSDGMTLVKEGRRLYTPRVQLDHALAFRPRLSGRGVERPSHEAASALRGG